MKQRVISALVGLLILAIVLFFLNTILFNIVMTLISVLAVLEMLNAVGCARFKGMTAFAVLIALVIPFARAGYIRPALPQILFLLVISFFSILLKNHDSIRVEQAAMTFMISIFIPLFFASGVYIRDDYGTDIGLFYLIWALGSGWLCDTGAYFVGLRFGKRKLAPHVSPKKTVEGAIGGLVVATAVMVLIAAAYAFLLPTWGNPVTMRYGLIALLTPVFAGIGILGDLSASVVKRQFNVKDYGNIMPGHGGILVRFDSVLFTLPAVYIAASYFQVAVPV